MFAFCWFSFLCINIYISIFIDTAVCCCWYGIFCISLAFWVQLRLRWNPLFVADCGCCCNCCSCGFLWWIVVLYYTMYFVCCFLFFLCFFLLKYLTSLVVLANMNYISCWVNCFNLVLVKTLLKCCCNCCNCCNSCCFVVFVVVFDCCCVACLVAGVVVAAGILTG